MYIFNWKQKSTVFIKIKCKLTGKSSYYLKDRGGWARLTMLLYHTSPHTALFLLPPPALLVSQEFNWEPPCTASPSPPSCSASIHGSDGIWEKFCLTDSLPGVIQRHIKTKVFPTPVRASSKHWLRGVRNKDSNKMSTKTLQCLKETETSVKHPSGRDGGSMSKSHAEHL